MACVPWRTPHLHAVCHRPLVKGVEEGVVCCFEVAVLVAQQQLVGREVGGGAQALPDQQVARAQADEQLRGGREVGSAQMVG